MAGQIQAKQAVGLVRVSRVAGRGGDSFQSPEQQRTAIGRLAEARGYKIYRWLEELDVSGKTLDRDAVDEALELVEAGTVRGIIAYDLSRFGRNAVGVLETRARVHAAGGELILGELDTSNTVAGDTVTGVMAVMAAGDHRRISERFELSKLDAFERGVYLASRAPFGYRFDADRRLVVEPNEAAAVLELFELRSRGGSWTAVVELFEARTGRSGVSRQTVRDLIGRRAYLGEARFGELVRISHAAIVGRELFELAQRPSARWSSENRPERFDGRAKSMLAGLARCGSCGSKMGRTSAGSKGSLVYRCSERSCSARVSIMADALEAFVEAEVLAWAEPIADEPVELLATSQAILDERRLELVERVAHAGADLEAFAIAATGLEADLLRRALEARTETLEAARRELESFDEANVDAVERADVRTCLREAWPLLDALERRALLTTVLDAVVVTRGRIVGTRSAVGQAVGDRARVVLAGRTAEESSELLEEARAEVVV